MFWRITRSIKVKYKSRFSKFIQILFKAQKEFPGEVFRSTFNKTNLENTRSEVDLRLLQHPRWSAL